MLTRSLPRRHDRRPLLARLVTLVLSYNALRRDRHRLALLDDHLLADIGLSRDEALTEGNRRAWDVPTHWRR